MTEQQAGGTSDPTSDPTLVSSGNEDAATAAARKELKHTVISEEGRASLEENDGSAPDADANATDDACAQDDDLCRDGSRHGLTSPKKKRRHDQVDKDKEADDSDVHSESSAGSRDRTLRSEPEKKRPRDEVTPDDGAPVAPTSPLPEAAKGTSVAKTTSPEAFASSGFAKLSSSQSPFGSLGTTQSSLFSNPTLAPPQSKPNLSFTSSASSPFASLGTTTPNGFGGGFGSFGGFGVLSSSAPLSSFAKPGEAFKSDKPSRPFGAPESDAEADGAREEESDPESSHDEADKAEKGEDKDSDAKKPRLQKVDIDDGEAGEITILQVRAKMFYLDKVSGWKERGAGMLKINVPSSCVQFDATGSAIPGSFDASELENDTSKVPRLILRQDQTHRVILNTALLPSAEFQEKPTLRATTVLFTAFEGDDAKPTSVTMKMSVANAKNFLAEVGSIQRELRGG